MEQWAAMGLGIHWVVLMSNGPGGGDPTLEGAMLWKTENNLQSVGVYPDKDFAFSFDDTASTPHLVLVDPRTMALEYVAGGYHDDNYERVEHLALQNTYP